MRPSPLEFFKAKRPHLIKIPLIFGRSYELNAFAIGSNDGFWESSCRLNVSLKRIEGRILESNLQT